MNVRDATPGDEPWLIETLDSLDDLDPGFRWYQYVVVTTDDGDRVGVGRITERDEDTAELDRVHGLGDRPTVARAHAARGLVKRALEDGFETILVAAETTRPFEAVGFRETEESAPVDAAHGEKPLQWVPPAEREDEEEESDVGEGGKKEATEPAETEAESSAGESQTPEKTESAAETADEEVTTESAGDDGGEPTYKYDTDSATPTTGATTTADEAPSKEAAPEDDDSTAAAARRQGFDPDRVQTKYDTDDKTRSATTKYDTGGETQSGTKTPESGGSGASEEADDTDSPDDDAGTKYDTDETDDSPNTKYSV